MRLLSIIVALSTLGFVLGQPLPGGPVNPLGPNPLAPNPLMGVNPNIPIGANPMFAANPNFPVGNQGKGNDTRNKQTNLINSGQLCH